MAPYRDELEAAQHRIDALEADVDEKAEQIEKLQSALESRDQHLQELRRKFDGAAPKQWPGRLLRHAVVAVAVVLVGAVFIIQFRPGAAQPPQNGALEASSTGALDAGAVPPASTLTLADPPAGGPKAAERPGASAATFGDDPSAAGRIRALQNKVDFGHPTEAELQTLRDLCLDYSLMSCARDAHERLRRLRGESTVGSYDEQAQRQALEPKVWSGNASEAEIRMLRAICSNQGDRACRDRATQMLKQTQERTE